MRAPCIHWLWWGALAALLSYSASGIATLASPDAGSGTIPSATTHHRYSFDSAPEAKSRTPKMRRHNQRFSPSASQLIPLHRRAEEEPTFYESKNKAKERRSGESKGKGKAHTNSKSLERKRKGYDADSESSQGTPVSPPDSPRLVPLAQSPRHYYGSSELAPFSTLSKLVQQARRHGKGALRRERGYVADTESKHSGGDSPSSPISREKKDKWMSQFAHAPHRPSKILKVGSKLTRPLSPSWREIRGADPFG